MGKADANHHCPICGAKLRRVIYTGDGELPELIGGFYSSDIKNFLYVLTRRSYGIDTADKETDADMADIIDSYFDNGVTKRRC